MASENLRISSECYFDELVNSKPNFSVQYKPLQSSSEHYYVDMLDLKFTFSLESHLLHLQYKITKPINNDVSFKSISFIIIIIFSQKEKKAKKIVKETLSKFEFSQNMTLNHIDLSLILKQFSNEKVTLDFYIKFQFIDTLLLNSIIYNFSTLSKDLKLKTLCKLHLIGLVNNDYLRICYSNEIAIFVGNWLLDENNLSQDPHEILSLVEWNNCSVDVLFEFIIKFETLIEKCNLEEFFSSNLRSLLEKQALQSIFLLN
jgi:hypothetical protein